MIVEDIMNRNVIKIDKDQNLKDALMLMEKKKVSRLIVVEEDKLVGIITLRDVMEILGSKKYARLPPSTLHVSMAMSKNPITIDKHSRVHEARDLMLIHKISTLPVVEGDKLVGILTKTDLLKMLIDMDEKITRYIRTKVLTVTPKDRVIHARRIMLEKNVGRLVVVEDDKISGIITDKDIVRAFYKLKKTIPEKYYEENIKKLLVEDVMSQNVITAKYNETIGNCVRVMLERKISGLPIVRDEKLYGIITKTDLIRLL